MRKTFKPYEGKEDVLNIACMRWLRVQYPNLLAFHVPNGGNRSKKEGAKFKAMGVLAGVPDILIIDYSLAIELKVKGGRLSTNQKNVIPAFINRGWYVEVVYSLEEFIHVVTKYINQ
jgi:hypothetical protein